jgi:hypothetical protein
LIGYEGGELPFERPPLTVVLFDVEDEGPALPLEVETLLLFLPTLPAFGVIEPVEPPEPPDLFPPFPPVVCFAKLSAYFEIPGMASHAFVKEEERNDIGGCAY